MASSRWLDRYLSGQREQVWRELRDLGGSVREQPELAAEAQAVCDEMARRARQNVETVVERLTAAGYRFHENDDQRKPVPPHVPPTPAAAEHADWLDRRFGPVPMTLRSWTRIVGDVWLVGTHPQWPDSDAGDPLVLDVEGSRDPDEQSIREYFAEAWDEWCEYRDEDPRSAGVFVLPLAPDDLHKANVSGGAEYGIVLPDSSVEGRFVGKKTEPFVSYLNRVFQHGGFPRRTLSAGARQVKRDLARDLLPL